MTKTKGIFLIAVMVFSLLPMVAATAPAVQLNDQIDRDALSALAKPDRCSPWPACKDDGTGGEDPGTSNQVKDWGYMRVGGDAARAATSGSVTVAVLDTGIDAGHSDLAGLVVACFSGLERQDYDCSDRKVTDSDGHGTHVAGTIAALDNDADSVGLAAGHVNLINGKVLGRRGGSFEDLAWSIMHAADLGADVITMSLGGDISGYNDLIKMIDDAVAYANQRGAEVIAAAGNEGTCDAGDVQMSYPAANKGVIAVGATGLYANGGFVTEWTGAEEDVMPCFSNQGPYVDISAPGVYITALKKGGGTTEMSGTSMATPYVAALVALIMAGGGSVSRIYSTAIDMGYDSTLQGAGLINAAAAV